MIYRHSCRCYKGALLCEMERQAHFAARPGLLYPWGGSMSLKWMVAEQINRYFLYNRRTAIHKFAPPGSHTLVEGWQKEELQRRLCRRMQGFFAAHPEVFAGWDITAERIDGLVRTYDDLVRNSPLTENKGGSTWNDAIWLYCVAALMQPEQIVESGTWKGFSAWLLRQACPGAAIDTFDIEHTYLRHREPDVNYHCCDWQIKRVQAAGPRSLCFFDDHVSHAQRIVEAYERGFRTLIVDDNYSVVSLYMTGVPPIPSVEMLVNDDLEAGQELQWLRNGKRKRFQIKATDLEPARSLIQHYLPFPELGEINRRGLHSGMALVTLKP